MSRLSPLRAASTPAASRTWGCSLCLLSGLQAFGGPWPSRVARQNNPATGPPPALAVGLFPRLGHAAVPCPRLDWCRHPNPGENWEDAVSYAIEAKDTINWDHKNQPRLRATRWSRNGHVPGHVARWLSPARRPWLPSAVLSVAPRHPPCLLTFPPPPRLPLLNGLGC